MEATVGLTLACLNMKKYSKLMARIAFFVYLKDVKSRKIRITKVKERQTGGLDQFVFNLKRGKAFPFCEK